MVFLNLHDDYVGSFKKRKMKKEIFLTFFLSFYFSGMINNGDEHNSAGYAYTTSCLVKGKI